MAGIGHRGFMGRNKQVSPVPLADLSFWYEFDNASKITEDGTNIQKIVDSSPNAFPMVPRVNDPVYSAAGGYSKFNFGANQSLQNVDGLIKEGAPTIDPTSGFLMMVMEFDAFTNGRNIGALSLVSGTTGFSGNVYGRFICNTSGGNTLDYNGRLTSSAGNLFTLDGVTVLTTGQKYLIQLYTDNLTGTYYEIDGVLQNTTSDGGRFCGIQKERDSPEQFRWRPELGQMTAASSYLDNQSHKVYEFISYESYDATIYADVETYLKTKYGIT